MSQQSKFSFVIRSIGESTDEMFFKYLLKSGIAREAIYILKNLPFDQALLESFHFAVDQSSDVLVCIDADVIPSPFFLDNLAMMCSSSQGSWFSSVGFVLDKLFCGPRSGGVHIYNLRFQEAALNYLSAAPPSNRPEGSLKHAMAKQGHQNIKFTAFTGLHDFYQSPADLYRTGFFFGLKNKNLLDYFFQVWPRRLRLDSDYIYALSGLLDCLRMQSSFNDSIVPSVRALSDLDAYRPPLLYVDPINTEFDPLEAAAAFLSSPSVSRSLFLRTFPECAPYYNALKRISKPCSSHSHIRRASYSKHILDIDFIIGSLNVLGKKLRFYLTYESIRC